MTNTNTYEFTKAVVNGRFQLPHLGHLACFAKALRTAEQVYILIGSAQAYPNTVNPFVPKQREDMIRLMLEDAGYTAEDMQRITFAYIDDASYRNEVWQADIRDAVDEMPEDTITMVGFDKDEQSWWLDTFGWAVTEVFPKNADNFISRISSTRMRKRFFETKTVSLAFTSQSVIDYLTAFAKNPNSEFERLSHEHSYMKKELAKFDAYPYKGSLNCSTGDAIVVCNGHLLVTKRGNLPGLGAYALPGGHKDANETYLDSALRELTEEIKLKVPARVIRGSVKRTKMFDSPQRSAPFCKPTLGAYIELMPDNDGSLPRIRRGDEVASVEWLPMHMVRRNKNKFFDDHYQIIQYFTGI